VHYEDQYAAISLMESVPCIKLKLSGIPVSSDHFQLVYSKLLEKLQVERSNYFKLHLITDCSKAGLISDEDIQFYKLTVLPGIVKAGIRYHGFVMPETVMGRVFVNEMFSDAAALKPLKIEFFKSAYGAYTWLKKA
jgi:hypothetical protein